MDNDNNDVSSSWDDDDDYDSDDDDSYESDIDNDGTNVNDDVAKNPSDNHTTMMMTSSTSTTPSKMTATKIQEILLLSSSMKKKRNNNDEVTIEVDSKISKKQKGDVSNDPSNTACKDDNDDCTPTALTIISQEEQEQIRCVVTAITMTMIPLSMIRKEEDERNKKKDNNNNTTTSTEPVGVDIDNDKMIPVVFTGHADGTITRWDMMYTNSNNKKHDNQKNNDNNIGISSSSSSFQKKWTIIGCTDLITKHGTSQSIHKNIGIAGLVIRCRNNQKNDDTKNANTNTNNTILLYSWSYQPDDTRYNINGIPQRIMIWNITNGKRISSIMIDIGKDSYSGKYANPLITSIVFATIKNTNNNINNDKNKKNDMQELKQADHKNSDRKNNIEDDEWIDTVIVAIQAICDDNDDNDNSTIGNILCFNESKRTLYNQPWNGHYYYPNCIITSLSVLPYVCIVSIAEMPYQLYEPQHKQHENIQHTEQTLDNDPNITSTATALRTTKDDSDHDPLTMQQNDPKIIYIIADMIIWDIYNPGVILHRFDFYNNINNNIVSAVIEQQHLESKTVATTPKMIHIYDKRQSRTMHLQPKTKIWNRICGIHSFIITPSTTEENNTTTTIITEPLTTNDDRIDDSSTSNNMEQHKHCSIVLMSNHGQLVTVFQVQLTSHRRSSNNLMIQSQEQEHHDETTTTTSNENRIYSDNKDDNVNDELVSSDDNNPKNSIVHEHNEKNDDVKGENANNQHHDCYVDIIGYVQLDHVQNHDVHRNNTNHNNDCNKKKKNDDNNNKIDAIVIRSIENNTYGRRMISSSSSGHMVGYNDQIVLSYSSLSSFDDDQDRKNITHDDVINDDQDHEHKKESVNTNQDMIYSFSGNTLYHYLLQQHWKKHQPQQHRNLSDDALLLPPQEVDMSSSTSMIGTSYYNATTVSIHDLVISKGQQHQDELLQDKDVSCSKPNVTKFVQKVMIPSHIHPIFQTPIVSSQLLRTFHITSLSINHDNYTVIGDSFGIFHYWYPGIQAMVPPIQQQQDSPEEQSSSSLLQVKGTNELNCYWNATRPTCDNDLYHPIPHLSSSSSKNAPELQNKCTIQ